MRVDADQHNIRLPPGFPNLTLDPRHIRFVGRAVDPVFGQPARTCWSPKGMVPSENGAL
jgi:hypothetical protein